jgi:protein-disulfide isomerase
MQPAITRKDLLQLLVVVSIGWGAAQLLRKTAPLGREMRANVRALAMLQDEALPRRDVSAPTLTIVVFVDYQCPACKLASPAMNAAVAKDGHVRVIYRDWPIFGPRSEDAARVALASARQGIYLSVHDRLMGERQQLDEAVMREAVEAAGGNWVRLQQDLRDDRTQIDSKLARNAADATSLGIAGTPAYLIGPILIIGALNADEFSRAFEAARTDVK